MSSAHAQDGDAARATDLPVGAATDDASSPAPLVDADGFLRAGPGRPIVLPRDHGSHPATRTEWWYLTGPLTTDDGALFGFQATWFRRALVAEPPVSSSPLAVRDVLLFHGAVIDTSSGEQFVSEVAGRANPPWGAAAAERLDVRLFDDVLVDDIGDGRAARLAFAAGDARVELQLDLASSPVLRHGEEPGLSIKGREPGQASWYYTLPRIEVHGTLARHGDAPVAVHGHAWLDHEFGSGQLGAEQVGWDWFSVALDDDTDLMLYQLRTHDGRADTSSGTLHEPGGTTRHLPAERFVIAATGTWTSDESGITYPSGWTLELPDDGLSLVVEPLVRAQELRMQAATGVTYWEGLCRFTGTRHGDPVTGLGYVELVGYGAPIADRFETRPAH
ncbi:MAG: carotenoid 1,2-hydratase [Planctomycetes bacterium]|nr:carotenoid 1,2-hydratase [Planctomycetota bacterium]